MPEFPLEFLRRLPGRIWRLFVEDGWMVAALLAWIVVACAVLTRLPPGSWSGPILFAGIAVVTFSSLASKG